MAARIIIIVLLAGTTMGCAHKVKVISSPPGAMISVDGKQVGKAPVTFEEELLPGSHRVVARLEGYRPTTVVVDRTEINWWWFAGGLTGCLLCYPAGCMAGAGIANIALCPACLGVACSGSTGPVTAILAAPSCFTVPLISVGALLGASPLGLLAFAEQSPDEIKVHLKKQ